MRRVAIAASLLLITAAPSLDAQTSQARQAGAASTAREFVFEFSGGVGFTSVDVAKWGGASAMNEEQMLYQYDARLLFARAGGFQFGVEGGYRYLFYYEVPFGTNTLYRDVAATRIAAVARRGLNSVVSVDLAAAAYLFEDFTDMGVSAALVFRIPVAGKVSIPLHVRTDVIMDEQMIIGSGATLGLSFRK